VVRRELLLNYFGQHAVQGGARASSPGVGLPSFTSSSRKTSTESVGDVGGGSVDVGGSSAVEKG